jgi:phosphoribosyl-ATP pyrophosphohydrolase
MSIIEELQTVLIERKINPREGSYTTMLLSNEEELVKKVGEEAVEVILAAVKQGNERLISETADLVYHLLVLLTAHDVVWADVETELEGRRGK